MKLIELIMNWYELCESHSSGAYTNHSSEKISKFSRNSGGSRISLRWGANPPGGGVRKYTILPNFSKNCIEFKEFGPPGFGRASLSPPPLRSATA